MRWIGKSRQIKYVNASIVTRASSYLDARVTIFWGMAFNRLGIECKLINS